MLLPGTYRHLLASADTMAAVMSDDPRTQVGVYIVDPAGQVIAYGANRLPGPIDANPRRLVRPLKTAFIEHAERDAIFYAARWGIPLAGATMVAPWAACAECARAIIAAGITHLVRRPVPESRWTYSIELGDLMLREAQVQIIELD